MARPDHRCLAFCQQFISNIVIDLLSRMCIYVYRPCVVDKVTVVDLPAKEQDVILVELADYRVSPSSKPV